MPLRRSLTAPGPPWKHVETLSLTFTAEDPRGTVEGFLAAGLPRETWRAVYLPIQGPLKRALRDIVDADRVVYFTVEAGPAGVTISFFAETGRPAGMGW